MMTQCRTPDRILLVEDDPINMSFTLVLLKRMGYRVDSASSGEEALKALASVPYDLVLMDVRMPGMDGFQTTGHIRRGEKGVMQPSVPVVALTADDSEGDREKCMETGMDDYVTKPIDPERLGRVVQGLIRKRPTGSAITGGFEESEPLFRRMRRIFLGKAPLMVDDLRQALASNDAEAVVQWAHTLKGGSALVEAHGLTKCASEIEKEGKNGRLETIPKLLVQLEQELERFSQPQGDPDPRTPVRFRGCD